MDKEIVELNRLWEPVRPYLSRQVKELYGRSGGRILEIGPFSGLIFDLIRENLGTSFLMAVFPGGIIDSLRKEARSLGLEERVMVVESDAGLSGVAQTSVDLAIFRGAFFFPSFFRPDLPAVYGSLRAGGVALMGGGFGRYTPKAVIEHIRGRSTELNLSLGRVHRTEEDLKAALDSAALAGKAEIISSGGLWVVLKRGED
jgi:hypothetical protein